MVGCLYPSTIARKLRRNRTRRTAGSIAAALALTIASHIPAAAQSAGQLEMQYTMDALQQALETRQRYALYGIHFDADKATIQSGAEPLLNDITTALKNFPEWQLRIIGHTDASGNEEANAALSLQRADAIKAALVDRGIDTARLQTAGLGQYLPIADNGTPEGRALNRRVELIRVTDSQEARGLLKRMSDHLAEQSAMAFRYDATLDVVTPAGQKLGLAMSGTVTLNRPDKLHTTRSGGLIAVETIFDGKTLTVLGKNLNKYAQIALPGTVDDLVDELKDKYGLPLPAADLLTTDSYDDLMQDVYDAKDLGSGVVNGIECDSLAFRKADVDFQIWIAQGDEPYPCRLVITSTLLVNGPQYTVQVTDWKTGDAVPKEDFVFTNTSGAEPLDIQNIKASLGDLPENFVVVGDGQ